MRQTKFTMIAFLVGGLLLGGGCGSEGQVGSDTASFVASPEATDMPAAVEDYSVGDADEGAAATDAEPATQPAAARHSSAGKDRPVNGARYGSGARPEPAAGPPGTTSRSDPASPPIDRPVRESARRGFAETEESHLEKIRPEEVSADEAIGSKYQERQTVAGTLTAGSFDDHQNLEDFKSFVSKALQNDATEVLPRLGIGRRVLLHVRNGQGQPVADARVQVRPAGANYQQQGQPLISLNTGTDGRTLFLTGRDRGTGDRYEVTVTPPDGGAPIVQVLNANQGPWHITLPESPSLMPTGLDLALVIDTTGSMSDELEYLKVEIDDIAAAVHQMFPNVETRFALVVYRDEGDAYVTRTTDFTGSLSEFRSSLARQRANGGGDYPEAMHVALEQASRLDWRGQDTARLLFLVGDAPPHDRFAARALAAVDALRQQNVRVYPVAGSGVKLKAEFVLRSAAFVTLGQYLFLTDHSGIGLPHATPHVPAYAVEHLNRLMLRMIASELAGRQLAPQQVIAIEQGDLDPADVEPEPIEQQSAAVLRPRQGQTTRAMALLFGDWNWRPPAWLILLAVVVVLGTCEAIVRHARRRLPGSDRSTAGTPRTN